MSEAELLAVKGRMIEYLEKTNENSHLDAVYFMLTNILTESTSLIYAGNKGKELIEKGYGITESDNAFTLDGVVSRKKQLLPQIMLAIKDEV